MKKKFKKLSLNTETLRNLGESSLKHAAGGVETDFCTHTGPCSECTKACTLCTAGCSVCCI
jgi:hypothetical protein